MARKSFAKVIVTRTQSDRTANANGDDPGCEQEDDKSLRNDVIHHFVRC